MIIKRTFPNNDQQEMQMCHIYDYVEECSQQRSSSVACKTALQLALQGTKDLDMRWEHDSSDHDNDYAEGA